MHRKRAIEALRAQEQGADISDGERAVAGRLLPTEHIGPVWILQSILVPEAIGVTWDRVKRHRHIAQR